MNQLPIELFLNIMQRLGSKNLATCLGVSKAWFNIIMEYRLQATISINSSVKLRKLIGAVNEYRRLSENGYRPFVEGNAYRPLAFTLNHIILYFHIENNASLISALFRTFPNIQSITTPTDTNPYSRIIVRTPSPISYNMINYWYKNVYIKNINSNRDNKRKLRSLQVNLDSHLPMNSSIYLLPIGPERRQLTHSSLQGATMDNNHEIVSYRNKMLVIPELKYLTSLSIELKHHQQLIRGNDYELNEKILDDIHQSCQNLEQLQLNNYYVNISSGYDVDIITQNNAPKLKIFRMQGCLFDSKICEYFTLKYPNLESFDFTYSYADAATYSIQYLQDGFYNMITRFSSLKELTLRSFSIEDNSKYWPQDRLIKWLNDHPKQLTHLDYPDILYSVPLPSPPMNKLSSNSFFHHLSSLAMRSQQLIETFINHLNHNDTDDNNTFDILKSIKHCCLYDLQETDNQSLYLFDILELFTNLDSLKLDYQVLVDTDDLNDQYMDNDDIVENMTSNNLHHLIKEKKRQLGRDTNDNKLYILKQLELNHVQLRYRELNLLFSRFSQLNRLKLNHINYLCYTWNGNTDLPKDINTIHVNMQHLSVDIVSITDIRINPWNGTTIYLERLVKKIKVSHSLAKDPITYHYETPTGNSNDYYRVLANTNLDHPFSMEWSFKYVDSFAFY
ncbi:unnamed protein product [Cunninghamella blakesleeana]